MTPIMEQAATIVLRKQVVTQEREIRQLRMQATLVRGQGTILTALRSPMAPMLIIFAVYCACSLAIDLYYRRKKKGSSCAK
jgi:hypothetical protein